MVSLYALAKNKNSIIIFQHFSSQFCVLRLRPFIDSPFKVTPKEVLPISNNKIEYK